MGRENPIPMRDSSASTCKRFLALLFRVCQKVVGLLKIVYQLSDWVFRIEKVLAVIFGATILISLSAGVIYRYFLKVPLLWSDGWLSFVCVDYIYRREYGD